MTVPDEERFALTAARSLLRGLAVPGGFGRIPAHVGLLTRWGVLHTARATGACIEPLAAIRQRYRLVRGFRWAG
jgi:hypothetical protein